MNEFLKNLMHIAAAALILAVPVLLTLSFYFGWAEAIQGILCLACLIDFLAVWVFASAFADALE